MGSRNYIKDGVVFELRNTILIFIALSIFKFSGCSNGADSVNSSSDSEYNELMAPS
jgi:PBP1b-binding outer membrane lipoprotein LpoB